MVNTMTRFDLFLKRSFDLLVAILGLALTWPLIGVCWLIAAIETRSNGFFIQQRVGRHGRIIRVCKIKTMYASDSKRSPLASDNLSSITRSGAVFRKYKLDELPQLFNVLIGDMSLVGPRPDVPGYADKLTGGDRLILSLRPGITGPASIKYKNEEQMLASVDDPRWYNDKVIWPDKVSINKEYFRNYSLVRDIKYIFQTLLG